MGRRKSGNAKTKLIRISPRVKYKLDTLKQIYGLPTYYKDGDVIQALVAMFEKESENETVKYSIWVGKIGDRNLGH